MSNANPANPGFAGRLTALFVGSKLTPLGLIASLLLGLLDRKSVV